ncbi:hypothetical protein MLD38_005631 [Melastoma candidum]|uniref:Uncharacterized protein n=1 Tax=Melastoma candidum TaxID=119954 RepID=A0ACB9RJW0_9MYRT|nr:hypothetical protein MLD38_005631 [Melastoma candidum]
MCHPEYSSLDLPRGPLRSGGQAPGNEARGTPTRDDLGGSGTGKWCLCSPTHHPGSFRCRFHQSEYKWAGRARSEQLK